MDFSSAVLREPSRGFPDDTRMGRRSGALFRQSDISRAIKGAKSAGLIVSQVQIAPDGKIVIMSGDAQDRTPADLYLQWKDGRVARPA